MTASLCFVAAPLIARSGVYNSTVELVQAARAAGLDWHAVIGTSRGAAGDRRVAEGVEEFAVEPTGPAGVVALARVLREFPAVSSADLVISMVPQTDMALALTRTPWVAYLRGRPWPATGESSAARAILWRTLEKAALRRAREVWATTTILAHEVGGRVDRLVPPGLVPPEVAPGGGERRDFVWAARYSIDKNPTLFFDALSGLDANGVMYGTGPLESELRVKAPRNVTVAGWRPRDQVWNDARGYVGTSSREAFGRSAVEAAMLGIPVVISREFGCAEMLYTDPAFANRFVLPVDDPIAWRDAIAALATDDSLHAETAAHLKANAANLTIDSAVSNVRAAAAAVLER